MTRLAGDLGGVREVIGHELAGDRREKLGIDLAGEMIGLDRPVPGDLERVVERQDEIVPAPRPANDGRNCEEQRLGRHRVGAVVIEGDARRLGAVGDRFGPLVDKDSRDRQIGRAPEVRQEHEREFVARRLVAAREGEAEPCVAGLRGKLGWLGRRGAAPNASPRIHVRRRAATGSRTAATPTSQSSIEKASPRPEQLSRCELRTNGSGIGERELRRDREGPAEDRRCRSPADPARQPPPWPRACG